MAAQSRPSRDKLRLHLRRFMVKMKHIRWLKSTQRRGFSKAKNIRRNREYGLQYMREMSDQDFQRMFRVTREGFQQLCDGIALRLSIDILQARRSSGSHISITTRLAVTLRWLGGGSYLDICLCLGYS